MSEIGPPEPLQVPDFDAGLAEALPQWLSEAPGVRVADGAVAGVVEAVPTSHVEAVPTWMSQTSTGQFLEGEEAW